MSPISGSLVINADGWYSIDCSTCRGYGVVSVYSHDDFEGPGVCPICDGGGTLFVSPQGRLAQYPGRFCGSLAKQDQEAQP